MGCFSSSHGEITFEWCKDCVDGFGWAAGDHLVKFDDMYSDSTRNERLVVHELGHLFDRSVCGANGGTGACGDNDWWHGETAHSALTGEMGRGVSGLGRPTYEGPINSQYWGFAGGKDNWQFAVNNIEGTVEVWADMFVGWTYGTWGGDERGTTRRNYMNDQMDLYLGLFGFP